MKRRPRIAIPRTVNAQCPSWADRMWSTRELKRMREMLDQGESVGDVCAEFGIGQRQLYHIRETLGWEIVRRDPERLRAGVLSLSAAGRSDGEVAEILGCTRAMVGMYRKELGIPAQRKRGGRQPKKSPAPVPLSIGAT